MQTLLTEETLKNLMIQAVLLQTDLDKVVQPLAHIGLETLEAEIRAHCQQYLKNKDPYKLVHNLDVFFERLKSKYKRFNTISMTQEALSMPEAVRELLEGIQVMFQTDLDVFTHLIDSSVTEETESLLQKQADSMKEEFTVVVKPFYSLAVAQATDEDAVANYILRWADEVVQVTLSVAMNTCTQGQKVLADLEYRPLVKRYLNFLDRQDKTMATLYLMQASIIESVLKDDYQRQVFEKLTKLAKDIYIDIGDALKALSDDLIQAETLSDTDVFKGYQDEWTQMLVQTVVEDGGYIQALNHWSIRRKDLICNMEIEIADGLEKFNSDAMKTLVDMSKTAMLISGSVQNSWIQLKKLLEQVQSYVMETDGFYPLITGIQRTIEMKLLAMQEADNHFHMLSHNDRIRYEKALYDLSEAIKNQSQFYFEQLLYGEQEALNKAYQQMIGHLKQFKNAIAQRDFSYLKRTVLSEVVSFEELIAGTREKLAHYGHPACQHTNKALISAMNQILEAFKQLDIQVMEASPGQRFNGKIHFVTLVETHDRYEKGQIIYQLTRGYRYQDIPVVPVHVVVAE